MSRILSLLFLITAASAQWLVAHNGTLGASSTLGYPAIQKVDVIIAGQSPMVRERASGPLSSRRA